MDKCILKSVLNKKFSNANNNRNNIINLKKLIIVLKKASCNLNLIYVAFSIKSKTNIYIIMYEVQR